MSGRGQGPEGPRDRSDRGGLLRTFYDAGRGGGRGGAGELRQGQGTGTRPPPAVAQPDSSRLPLPPRTGPCRPISMAVLCRRGPELDKIRPHQAILVKIELCRDAANLRKLPSPRLGSPFSAILCPVSASSFLPLPLPVLVRVLRVHSERGLRTCTLLRDRSSSSSSRVNR